MPDPHYPTVDISFIEQLVTASGKLEDDGIIKFGSTTAFVKKGQQAIHKRLTQVRELEPGHICFEQAVALALDHGFLTQLLEWLVKNRNWRDGGYIVP